MHDFANLILLGTLPKFLKKGTPSEIRKAFLISEGVPFFRKIMTKERVPKIRFFPFSNHLLFSLSFATILIERNERI